MTKKLEAFCNFHALHQQKMKMYLPKIIKNIEPITKHECYEDDHYKKPAIYFDVDFVNQDTDTTVIFCRRLLYTIFWCWNIKISLETVYNNKSKNKWRNMENVNILVLTCKPFLIRIVLIIY